MLSRRASLAAGPVGAEAEQERLAVGMCFSNEPGIYLPGKFGVRLEDCFHMTATGPKWFSVPAKPIEEPIG